MKPQVTSKEVKSEKIREDFEPFVMEGLVLLDGNDVNPEPVKIMRDTCCAQSVILEGSLPFREVSATGERVLIQGFGMNIICVPLHKTKLKTDLVSGTVVVGVRPELPVKGVSMLLGNDLASEKYFLSPSFPIVPAQKLSPKRTKIFSLPVQYLAVTGSMTRKACVKLVMVIKWGDGVPSLGL